MKRITFWGFMALVCCIFSAPVHCLASDGMQPFVLVTDRFGSSNFSMSNGDGTLTDQQELVRYNGTSEDWTYCNGIGDFDNDGVLDIIIAVGSDSGIVYRFGTTVDNGSFPQGEFTGPHRGLYPAKMAVADFNNDGKLDFIMTYDGSAICDLFMGDGNMGFTLKDLPGTAPVASTGADAGDFNGDGLVDFVVVSDEFSNSVYFNLQRDDGTFDTQIKNLDYTFSVAAADFNDDGLDDLAFSASTYWIYIYTSTIDADGNLSLNGPSFVIDPKLNFSPIDAWDFDGDQKPDLVIGSYRSSSNQYVYTDIAVRKGIGGGLFETNVATYGGYTEGLSTITAISAPTPFQPEIRAISNIPPVAEISCDSPEVSAGKTVYVYADEEGTYDPDGEIMTYQWDFGDGTLADGPEAEHVYYEAGEYTIMLTVTDDQEAQGSAEFLVKVSAISARMRVFPRVLNLHSRSRWMYAAVRLPEGCDANQVAVDSISIIADNSAPQPIDLSNGKRSLVVYTHKWLARHNKFYLKFDRRATIKAIKASKAASDQITIRINGVAHCNDGFAEFSADDTIRTIERHKKKWYRWRRR